MAEGHRDLRAAIGRRSFLAGGAALLLYPHLSRADHHGAGSQLGAEIEKTFETSSYVYISPLKSNGEESLCHGEVWYAWMDGAVFVTCATETWKARALASGLKGARIWVGDYGRSKSALGRNEKFRAGPMFDASGERVSESEKNEALLAIYEKKYPDAIGRWRDPMREGFADGSRHLIRYTLTPRL